VDYDEASLLLAFDTNLAAIHETAMKAHKLERKGSYELLDIDLLTSSHRNKIRVCGITASAYDWGGCFMRYALSSGGVAVGLSEKFCSYKAAIRAFEVVE
jgi:hypothetical protein